MEDIIKALFGFVIVVFLVIAGLSAIDFSLTSYELRNYAEIQTYDLMVYSDPQGENTVNSVYWGTLTPGENKTLPYYLRSSVQPGTLKYKTENWIPEEAPDYITFQVVPIDLYFEKLSLKEIGLRLTVSPDISGITTFSFDIILFLD